jgi:CHAD domain-containing protein
VTVQSQQAKSYLEVFDQRVLDYRDNLQSCQHDCSVDAVHDLRVSIRRLLALVELLRQVFPELPRCRKLRRRLRTLLSDLSSLRDVQVMIATVRIWPMTRASQRFALWLLRGEVSHKEQVVLSLAAYRAGKVERRLARLRKQLGVLSSASAAEVSPRFWQSVFDTCRQVRACQDRVLQPLDFKAIHRVRIAFKRFRYAVELAEAVSPRLEPKFFHWMRDWQTLMGDLQDAAVIEGNVRHFAADRLNFDDFPLLEQVVSRREQCVRDYWQRREELTGLQLPAA